ncbi:MAG: hypothetical protein Q9195_004676 [Heterodermia aff. obscurata]
MSPLQLLLLTLLTPLALSIKFTNSDYGAITAGETFDITWDGGDGSDITLALLTGDPSDLQPVMEIASASTTSPFTWLVPTDLDPETRYVLSIEQAGKTNYSPGFEISGSAPTTDSPTNATSEEARLSAPTPTYIVHGLLGGTNSSEADRNGTVALPTESSRVGQYAVFEGGVGRVRDGMWLVVVEIMAFGVVLMA